MILANLLLIQAWSLAPSIVAASWSVSTEVAAYLAFPLLLRLTVFARRGRAVDSLLMASLLLILAAIGGHILGPATNGALDLSDGTTPWPLLRCLGGFMLGLLTFRLAQIERIMTLAANDWCVVAVIAAFGLALWSGLPDLAVYPCLPLIVLIAATDRAICRPACWPIARYTGSANAPTRSICCTARSSATRCACYGCTWRSTRARWDA